jgi:FHA domain
MAVCPNGHDSASDDFCDICGMRIAAAPSSSQSPGSTATPGAGSLPAGTGGTPGSQGAPGSSPVTGLPGTSPGQVAPLADPDEPCPRCGTARSGQFCEACGYKFDALQPSWSPAPPTRAVPGSPPGPAAWTAVVSPDRDYYERVRAESGPDWAEVPFPAYCAERRFRLTGNQMRIGRRSVSRGLDPEIDLTGPPVDPGISRLHAVLIARSDGSWTVLDPGSANGTLVNGNEVPTDSHVPLHDGDRINLGAWTAITVHRG